MTDILISEVTPAPAPFRPEFYAVLAYSPQEKRWKLFPELHATETEAEFTAGNLTSYWRDAQIVLLPES